MILMITITHYIRLVLYHDIKKFDEKISKEKIINILQKEFSDVLNYALESRIELIAT